MKYDLDNHTHDNLYAPKETFFDFQTEMYNRMNEAEGRIGELKTELTAVEKVVNSLTSRIQAIEDKLGITS